MSCCHNRKTRVELEYPIKYKNFVSYPTCCKHLDILTYHNFAEIVFPSIVTGTTLQISVLDYTTNTLVYDINGEPVLATMIEPHRPYDIYFSPNYGGYVLGGFTVPDTSESGETIETSVLKVSKEVIKK